MLARAGSRLPVSLRDDLAACAGEVQQLARAVERALDVAHLAWPAPRTT